MSKTKIEIRADIPVIVFPCGGCRPCGHAEYEIIKELEAEKTELIEALKWFCMRVAKGEVKSKLTYARFQRLLHKHTEEVKGWLSLPI